MEQSNDYPALKLLRAIFSVPCGASKKAPDGLAVSKPWSSIWVCQAAPQRPAKGRK